MTHKIKRYRADRDGNMYDIETHVESHDSDDEWVKYKDYIHLAERVGELELMVREKNIKIFLERYRKFESESAKRNFDVGTVELLPFLSDPAEDIYTENDGDD